MNQSPFTNSHNAMVFAFNFSHQAYEPPLMNRLAWGPMAGISKGLGGMDGAAQAGMILSELQKLTLAQQFVVIIKYAPAVWPCHCRSRCCSGFMRNTDWEEAVSQLGMIAAAEVIPGVLSQRQLRNDMIKKSFGHLDLSISDIGRSCGVSERTAAGVHAQIRKWLRGERNPKDASEYGLIDITLERADRILRNAGIVREAAEA